MCKEKLMYGETRKFLYNQQILSDRFLQKLEEETEIIILSESEDENCSKHRDEDYVPNSESEDLESEDGEISEENLSSSEVNSSFKKSSNASKRKKSENLESEDGEISEENSSSSEVNRSFKKSSNAWKRKKKESAGLESEDGEISEENSSTLEVNRSFKKSSNVSKRKVIDSDDDEISEEKYSEANDSFSKSSKVSKKKGLSSQEFEFLWDNGNLHFKVSYLSINLSDLGHILEVNLILGFSENISEICAICFKEQNNLRKHLKMKHSVMSLEHLNILQAVSKVICLRSQNKDASGYFCSECGGHMQRIGEHLQRVHDVKKEELSEKRKCAIKVKDYFESLDELSGFKNKEEKFTELPSEWIEEVMDIYKHYLKYGCKLDYLKQMKGQIMHFLKYAFESNINILEIKTTSDAISLSMVIFEYLSEMKKASSTQSLYLISLEKFFKRILLKYNSQGLPTLLNEIRGIKGFIQKKGKAERYEYMKKMQNNEFDITIIENFFASPLVKSIKEICLQYRAQENIPSSCQLKKIYTTVVGIISISISLTNAVRPGAICNMTMKEFNEREEGITKTFYTIGIKEHKTKHLYGDVFIHITKDILDMLEIYLNNFRPQFAKENDVENFFINSVGKKYKSNALLAVCQHVWKESEITEKWFTFNAVRHSKVTFVHKYFPELAKPLARQMAHSESTAKKCYINPSSKENSQKEFENIHETINKNERKNKEKQETPKKEETPKFEKYFNVSFASTSSSFGEQTQGEKVSSPFSAKFDSPNKFSTPSSTSSESVKVPKRFFTVEERHYIRNLFEELFNKNIIKKPYSLTLVRANLPKQFIANIQKRINLENEKFASESKIVMSAYECLRSCRKK